MLKRKYLRYYLAALLILLLGFLWAAIGVWHDRGEPAPWHWNEASWQAVTTGLVGLGLGLLAYRSLRVQNEQRQFFQELRQADTTRELLTDVLVIHALEEAWILDGEDWEQWQPLSENRGLPSDRFRRVALRVVLDESPWNAPSPQYYSMQGGERTWIVRDRVIEGRSYRGALEGVESHFRPALISSKAMFELTGWIERVALAHSAQLVTPYGLAMMRNFLRPVEGKDRTQVMSIWLTSGAQEFLNLYRSNRKQEELR